jgi:hypothetical protein
MPNPNIDHPSRAVPFVAVAFGDAGQAAVAVSRTNPLPSIEQAYSHARALTANVLVTPGISVLIDCAGDGKINLELTDGTQLAITVSAGLTILPFAVQRFVSTNTTAVFSAWVMD